MPTAHLTTAGTVSAMLDATASAFPDRTALVYGDERIAYGELRDRVDRVAAGLAERGVGRGDPVAVVLPNVPAFAVAFLAVARAGAVVVPLNPQFKEAELEFHFRECGVRGVVAEPHTLERCSGMLAGLPGEVLMVSAGGVAEGATALEELAADGAPAPASPDLDAVFQYSSGSTGRPKRVPRSHRHLTVEADAYVAATGMGEEDVVFCTIPLFHTYGMGCCLLAAVRSGATLVLFHEPNPFVLQRGRALALIERERATLFPAVPFTFRLLSEAAEAAEAADLSSLRLCLSAAAPLPRSVFTAFEARFGLPVRQLYGLTEAGAVTVNLDPDPGTTAGSVGLPLEGVGVRVVGEDGQELGEGRIGEIVIRSPAMMPGYADAAELNAEAFEDGWFRTGDRGRIDEEGRLHITGRKKLLIDVRGDKVDPIEVEDVLAVHPKVGEVVVVGVASDVEGEELVKAVVVPAGDCGERELIRYCRERLADYKVPQRVEFRDEIPLSAAGKVLRKYLVD